MQLGKPGGIWAKPFSVLPCSVGQGWLLRGLREASGPKARPSAFTAAAGPTGGITFPCRSGLAFGRAGVGSKAKAQAEVGPCFPDPSCSRPHSRGQRSLVRGAGQLEWHLPAGALHWGPLPCSPLKRLCERRAQC